MKELSDSKFSRVLSFKFHRNFICNSQIQLDMLEVPLMCKYNTFRHFAAIELFSNSIFKMMFLCCLVQVLTKSFLFFKSDINICNWKKLFVEQSYQRTTFLKITDLGIICFIKNFIECPCFYRWGKMRTTVIWSKCKWC